MLICLPAGTKRFKSAAGDHITEFLRADCAVSAEGGSAEQCLPVDPCIEHCGGTSDDLPRGKCAEQETDPYTFVDCHDSDLSFNHVHQQHSLVDVLCGWILSLILDEAVNVWVLVKAFSKGKAGKTTNAVHEE